MKKNQHSPWWSWTWPVLAWAVLILAVVLGPAGPIAAAAGLLLIATVFAAVYHAEVVAHRVGEPFGTRWSHVHVPATVTVRLVPLELWLTMCTEVGFGAFANAGAVTVTAVNPPPGGGTSLRTMFQVSGAAPAN